MPSRSQLLAEVTAEAPRHAASAVRLNIAIAQKLGMGLPDVQCMGLLMDGPAAPSDLLAARQPRRDHTLGRYGG